MHKLIAIAILLGAVALAAGCSNDPASRRRIQLRQTHYHETVADLSKREASSPARLRESLRWLDSWWRRDVADFNRRRATIGDYIW